MDLALEAGSRLEGYPGTRGNLTISGVATPQIVRDPLRSSGVLDLAIELLMEEGQ